MLRVLRERIERRQRRRRLGKWLDEMHRVHGPVDKQLVAKYLDLLR